MTQERLKEGAMVLSLGSLLSLLSFLLLLPRVAGAVGEFPAFSNYVVDEAGVVPDGVEHQVDATLADYQKRSSNQVAVAVVRTTGGRAIEEYSLALATTWGVGQQGKDNGVLVVIAYEDRRVRIEVGRGLQTLLTSQAAAGIVDGGLVPRLRQGDVGGAVVFATDSIRRSLGDTLLAGVPGAPVTAGVQPVQPVQPVPRFQPAPYQTPFDPVRPGAPGGGSGFPAWIFLAFPVLAVIGIASSFGSSRRSGFRSSGPMFWGQSPGWGGDRARHSSMTSWASSQGSGGAGGGGSGGSFGGGGGGSFGGGGASGSW